MPSLLKSKQFKSLLGWAVSLALLGAIFYVVDWAEVVNSLKEVNYLMLLPLTAVICFHFLLRAVRWRYLLPKAERIPLETLHDALMLGNLASYLLPLRAGEFIRPYLLARESGHSFAQSFASVVIERFFDLSVVLLLFALVVQFVPGLPDIAFQGAYALALLALGLLGFMMLGVFANSFIKKLCQACIKPFPSAIGLKLEKFLINLLDAVQVLRSKSNLLIIILLSIAVWASCVFYYILCLWMFGLYDSLWFGVCLTVIVALAVAAPSAPGFVGIFEAACLATFSLFGVPEEKALAFALVNHVHQFIYIVGFGFYVLLKHNLSLAGLKQIRVGEPK